MGLGGRPLARLFKRIDVLLGQPDAAALLGQRTTKA